MPENDKVLEEAAIVAEAKDRLKGVLNIDYVTPDHYAQFPKPCMGGWAKESSTLRLLGACCPAMRRRV